MSESQIKIDKLDSIKYRKLAELVKSGDIEVIAKTDKGITELIHVLGNMTLEEN